MTRLCLCDAGPANASVLEGADVLSGIVRASTGACISWDWCCGAHAGEEDGEEDCGAHGSYNGVGSGEAVHPCDVLAADVVSLREAGKEADEGSAGHWKEHKECVGDSPPAEERGFELVPDAGERLLDSLLLFPRLFRSCEGGERW